MYLMTHHRTFVATGPADDLVHTKLQPDRSSFVAFPSATGHTNISGIENGAVIATGALAGFELVYTPLGLRFMRNGLYLCAEPSRRVLCLDRVSPGPWETFILVRGDEPGLAPELYTSAEAEVTRLNERVIQLITDGRPVKIYCGAGEIPRHGFLNLDIAIEAPLFSISNSEDYFIFPFADRPWDIPSSSVDYVFHEDFIEHINQLQQFQFLSEALRVMKPGSWHRVNTPNLITAMKYNSHFEDGFRGVYTGELRWGHVSLFSPSHLAEVATIVGYREVVFTTKHGGVSPFAEPDRRPADDRDDILGNIYADLLK